MSYPGLEMTGGHRFNCRERLGEGNEKLIPLIPQHILRYIILQYYITYIVRSQVQIGLTEQLPDVTLQTVSGDMNV